VLDVRRAGSCGPGRNRGMITVDRDALLLVPAILSIAFMLWFLVMLWREERRKR